MHRDYCIKLFPCPCNLLFLKQICPVPRIADVERTKLLEAETEVSLQKQHKNQILEPLPFVYLNFLQSRVLPLASSKLRAVTSFEENIHVTYHSNDVMETAPLCPARH